MNTKIKDKIEELLTTIRGTDSGKFNNMIYLGKGFSKQNLDDALEEIKEMLSHNLARTEDQARIINQKCL